MVERTPLLPKIHLKTRPCHSPVEFQITLAFFPGYLSWKMTLPPWVVTVGSAGVLR
jgi:hypothetical protein